MFGCLGTVYLAKSIKSKTVMSQDRRPVEDYEILGLFEHYLRRWAEDHPGDTLVVTKDDKPIFEAKLIEKEDEEE